MSMLQKCLSIGKREQALANQNAAHLDCRLMMHRDALDKAEDRRMDLFREARKRKKLSHVAVNERCQKHLDRINRFLVARRNNKDIDEDAESIDSLDSIFCQIVRQDENIEESQRRLIKAQKDANSLT